MPNPQSHLPTQHDGERTTEVGRQIPVSALPARLPARMRLILNGKTRTGVLISLRPSSREGVYFARTADRADQYLVKMDPVTAGNIMRALKANDPYGQRLADSMKRQRQEACRRLGSTE